MNSNLFEVNMILKWQLKNFKSIATDMNTIDFSPITIISGANSSGKSTLIQSIQLMMQTLSNRENIPLQLNGDLVNLGQVGDLWHNGVLPEDLSDTDNLLVMTMELQDLYQDNNNIFIQVNFAPSINPTQVGVVSGKFGIGSSTGNEYKEYLEIRWDSNTEEYLIEKMSDSLRDKIRRELFSKGLRDVEDFSHTTINMEDFYPRALLVKAKENSREINWATVLSDPINVPVTDEELKYPIPDEIWEILLIIAEKLNLHGLENSPIWRMGKKQRAVKTLEDYRSWFGSIPTIQAQKLRDLLVKELPGIIVAVEQWHTVSFFERIESSLTEIFTRKIRYLSANRLAPTMLFTSNTNVYWSEVGITGENVAPAIREYSQRRIKYWDPISEEIKEDKLTNALIVWLKYFDLVERVEAEDRGKLGTLLKIYAYGVNNELDLTSVGFGTSQVLPIIVQGLLTPPRGLFIVEQPEVHLHPRVQSQLADFFLSLTRSGVQCIIETHSEHIINRVRLRIVEDEGHDVLDNVSIYFVEKAGAKSRFLNVAPNEYGAILKWPDGFFDQVENENIKIARLASKKRKEKTARKK
jgi:predicted ATPase